MGKIAAGAEFGRVVPQAGNLPQTERGAFGSGRAVAVIGERMQREDEAAEQDARRVHDERVQQQQAADKARAVSKIELLRVKLDDTARAIDQEVQDGRVPKDAAAKVWKERTAELARIGMEEVPQSFRGLAQQDFEGQVARHESRVTDAVRRRNMADTRADLFTTLQTLERSATTDYAGSLQRGRQALDTLGPAAGLQPVEIEREFNRLKEGAAYTRAFTAVNKARTDNKALSAVAAQLEQSQDIDPQRKAQLLAQIDGYRAQNEAAAIRQAQRAEIAAARRDRESASALSVLSGWAQAGKMADPQANAALLGRLTPEHAAAYRALAAEVPKRTAVAMLPLPQQQAELDALIARRNTAGTSEALEAEIKRREAVLTSARKEYEADPLRAAAERGVIDAVQPLDMSSLEGLAASVVSRVRQAETVRTRTGRAESPFLPEEASRFGDMLSALGPSQRANAIAKVTGGLPPGMAGAIARQINDKDRVLALGMSLGAGFTTQGRYASELLFRGAQAFKDGKAGTASEKGDATRQKLREGIIQYLDGGVVGMATISGQAREDIIESAIYINAGLDAVDSKAGAERAVRLAVGGDIVEHNGKRIPVPAGIGVDTLRERLTRYSASDLTKQAPDGYVIAAGARPMGLPEFVAQLPSMPLEPAGYGRFYVRSGAGIAQNTKGRPIVIEVK